MSFTQAGKDQMARALSESLNEVRVLYGPPRWEDVPHAPETMWERVAARFGRRFTRRTFTRSEAVAVVGESVAAYGPRTIVLDEPDIRERAEALALAEAILSDPLQMLDIDPA